jgi:hypothetical protein
MLHVIIRLWAKRFCRSVIVFEPVRLLVVIFVLVGCRLPLHAENRR